MFSPLPALLLSQVLSHPLAALGYKGSAKPDSAGRRQATPAGATGAEGPLPRICSHTPPADQIMLSSSCCQSPRIQLSRTDGHNDSSRETSMTYLYGAQLLKEADCKIKDSMLTAAQRV